MLKRTKETVRAVAESAGLVAPSLADAQRAAEERREALVVAQRAAEVAEQALQSAHDRGAEPAEISRAEAALADAKLTAERAQRAFAAGEKRLQRAQESEAAAGVEQGRAAVRVAVAERGKAAGEIGAALAALSGALDRMDSADEKLAALQSKGHFTKNASHGLTYGAGATRARVLVAVEDILNGAAEIRTPSFEAWAAIVSDLVKPEQYREPAAVSAGVN